MTFNSSIGGRVECVFHYRVDEDVEAGKGQIMEHFLALERNFVFILRAMTPCRL